MPKTTLGEFEHHVLLAVLRLGSEAYSVTIYDHLDQRLGREISLAAVYVALRRLEKKNLVKTRIVKPRGEASHHRRYVRLTGDAMKRMRESRRAFLTMWDGVEPMLEDQ